MNIHLKAVDASGNLIFESSVVVDAAALVAVSKPRVDLARTKGREFTEGAVPFFASALLQAAQRGATDGEMHTQSLNTAMASYLADSVYGGVSDHDFMNSNLHFTLMATGAVKYDRMRAAEPPASARS